MKQMDTIQNSPVGAKLHIIVCKSTVALKNSPARLRASCSECNRVSENKKSPVKGRGNLMFSQRNNPYCDLLHFSFANIRNVLNKRQTNMIYFF